MESRKCHFCAFEFDDTIGGENVYREHLLEMHIDDMIDELVEV